jgi:class 3 adenylate cyclase/tetratricopeptide (TPR) repeat protein
VERIINSKTSLEGERKHVTVLFADLKGSMELLADRDPEEARKILDPVLELMMEAVHRYEGTVNQVMGDGIMALFGAPLAHEDHAVRACYAALRMQESVKKYAEDVRRSHAAVVKIRVGLNSGEVVVRAIGSDLHMDYTAVGQTTHLAARMEQIADPGAIVIAPETLALVEGYVEVKSLGPVPVRGLAEPVEIYEVTGAGQARTRLQSAVRRGLTRFVGRDTELEQLRRAQQVASTGHGQVAVIVGEAGVGKSRLVYEFTHSHRLQDWRVLESASVSYGKATSYLPVIDLLKGYFKIQDRNDLREIQEKVTGKLLTLDRALEPTLPALLALLDVPVDDAAWRMLDPGQRRQRTLDAVRRLLLREAREQPLLLIFEDLHWIDGETQALLDSLVEGLPSARILLLVNYRPEYTHQWGSKTYYTQLRLDPLSPASAHELLHDVLGDDAGLDSLKPVLLEWTEGNPFFLEESLRTLVETGVLLGERGAHRLARALPEIQVPATVQAILAARIDRLPPDEKRLLQSAAVVGKDVPFALLAAIADAPEAQLRRGLAHLQAAEFMYETSLFPDLEYTFKHALTHEVAYGSVLHDRRRALHAGIAEAVEAFYADRLTEHAERLGYHAFRGELWEKALACFRQAGIKALARSANREATACFEQALAALGHLPDGKEKLEQAIDLRFDLRSSLWPLGEIERTGRYLREAERLASLLNDPSRLGWASAYLSNYAWISGDATEAQTFGHRAHIIAEGLPELPLRIVANYYLGVNCLTSGDYRLAETLLQANVDSLQGDLRRDRFGLAFFPSVLSRVYLAWSLAERGEFERGILHAQAALEIAEEVGQPFSLVQAYWGFARLRRIKGELDRTIQLLDRAVVLCRGWNVTLMSALVTWSLGDAYTSSGRAADGLPLLEQAQKAVEAAGMYFCHPLIVTSLGEGYLSAGRLEDGLAHAGRALTLARERGERGHEAHALCLLGAVACHHNPPDVGSAEGRYGEALALAAKLGMRPLIAHCHFGLGKLYRRTGKRQDAQEHLTMAATMYRDMDMRFWLEQARAEVASG